LSTGIYELITYKKELCMTGDPRNRNVMSEAGYSNGFQHPGCGHDQHNQLREEV
jgi:hypothetical protein